MSIFRDAVREGTFLHHYLEYMSPLETPLAYDFWTGMWLLSTAVGRRIVVNRPAAPVFLNLYVVLCADAGTTRKSTAVRRGEAVYRAAGFDQSALTVTGNTTPERLLDGLATRTAEGHAAECNIVVSELVTVLGKEQYNIAMPGLLTDLYDSPSYREIGRIKSGAAVIRDVCVTFFAASTPSWLVRAINPDVIEGGFTSRCLFVIEERRKRLVAWPSVNPQHDTLMPRLTELLLRVRRQSERWATKGICLTDNALARFVRWYENRTESDGTDPFIASFEAREDHHILRCAGLLAVNDDCFVIEVRHIEHAIRIITHHKQTAAALFGVNRESTRLTAGIDKLRSVLLDAGAIGIGQSELLFKTRTKLRTRELEYALNIMHELEMVQRFEVATGGRKKTIWRATNKLLVRDLNKLLLEKLNA